MWAIVPLKSPDAAKSRLAALLDAADRRGLFFGMAEHVLRTLLATSGVTHVAVVTASREIESFARRLRVDVIRQPADAGTAHAFAAAVEHLLPQRLSSLLMISGDLPLLSTAAVRRMIADTHLRPSIVLAPDRRGVGTNALRCSPPDAVPPCFGVDSLARHLAAAQRSGVAVERLNLEELAVDLDDAADLDYLRQRSIGDAGPRGLLHPPGEPIAAFQCTEG